MLNDRIAVTCFQTLLKKSNVKHEMEQTNNYIVNNLADINRNTFPARAGSVRIDFNSDYYISGGQIVVSPKDSNAYVKLLIVYLKYCYTNYSAKTKYPPQSLLAVLDYDSFKAKWVKYLDKSLTDYLDDNKTEGCSFTEQQVVEKYPQVDSLVAKILYRVCNSLGKLLDLKDFENKNISGFEINTAQDSPTVADDNESNDFFRECVNDQRYYSSLSGSKLGKAKLEANAYIFKILLKSASGDFDIDRLSRNPLAISKFMNLYTNHVTDSETFKSKFEALKSIKIPFASFIKKAFGIRLNFEDSKIFYALPKERQSDVLSDDMMVESIVRDAASFTVVSDNNYLPERVDRFVTQLLLELFPKTKASFPNKIMFGFLHYFALSTTNSKRFNDTQESTIEIEGETLKISLKFITSYLRNAIQSQHPDYADSNIVRLWCNKRSNLALDYFKSRNIQLYLYSKYPRLLNYMRFDYFKGLDMGKLTDEERLSIQTLRCITEDRSEGTLATHNDLNSWILRP